MGRSNITAGQLQQILARLGIVQEDFAAVFNVNQATVSRWLNGRVGVPGYVEAWLREVHPEIHAEFVDE